MDVIPLNEPAGVFLVEDDSKSGLNAFRDVGASRALNSIWQLLSKPNMQEMMRVAEARICQQQVSSPLAYVPTVFQDTVPKHVWIELAGTPAEFGYGGAC